MKMKFVIFAALFMAIEKIGLKCLEEKAVVIVNKNEQLKMKDDLRETVTKLDVPTYFFSGEFDYTINHKMSAEYLKQIEAPIKGFYLFKNSAHSPIFEEPKKVLIIGDSIKEGIIGTNYVEMLHPYHYS